MAEKVNENRPSHNRPDRAAYDRTGRVLTPQKTPEKSPFQKLLDETTQQQDSSSSRPSGQPTATETREAVKPAAYQQERFGREKGEFEKRFKEREREKESDRDEVKSGGSKESGAPRAKEAEKRVIARSSVGEQKHQGKGEGGGHGGAAGQEKKGKGFAFAPGLKGMRRGEKTEAGPGGFVLDPETSPPGSTAAAVLKAKTPTVLTKALLDQLVQYCRLVIKTEGDKEIDIQLHEEIFKGLRLRVAMVKGKVEATFLTQSQDTRDLFQAQKSEIRKTLAEKGIDVGMINVIMI